MVPHTARHFARAIIMPNLVPPVNTTEAVRGGGRRNPDTSEASGELRGDCVEQILVGQDSWRFGYGESEFRPKPIRQQLAGEQMRLSFGETRRGGHRCTALAMSKNYLREGMAWGLGC